MSYQADRRLLMLLPPAEPPDGLGEALLARLEFVRIASAKRRFIFDACIAALSGVTFVLTARAFFAEAALSGTFQYLATLFTSGASVFAYWQDALLSSIEAFPSALAPAPLAAVLVLLLALQRAVRDGSTAFHRCQTA